MRASPHYELIAASLRWLAEHQADQPDLASLAEAMDVSAFHLQRIFQQWAGVTPKQFLKSLTRGAALQRLQAGESVLQASLSTGLSGPGRLHDLLVTTEAMTPGEARSKANGVQLSYGSGQSPFGPALIVWSSRGICFLGFTLEQGRKGAFDALQHQWSNAEFFEDTAGAECWLEQVFEGCGDTPLPVWLRGSPFQLKVWEALLAIPEDINVTYGQIARSIGKPGAAQAVGKAVGSNPVSWLIPCHRVIRQLGELGGYRWGLGTKSAMIGLEASRPRAAKP